MSDPVPALGGARFDGFVAVEEMPPRGMITLRGDLSSAELQGAATGATGCALPGPLQAQSNAETGLAWMSPDEVLVLLPYGDVAGTLTTMTAALAGHRHLLADVSDARAVFRLTGPGLREVLAKLTPADMSPEAFPVGAFRRTRLAQAPAALWLRNPEMAEVMCFRSVAQYVFDLLANAAKPGAEVAYWR